MHQVRQIHQLLRTMSKAALTLIEDAKAITHIRKFSNTLWETNKKQKTQATNPPTPLNSPLPEGYPPSSPTIIS